MNIKDLKKSRKKNFKELSKKAEELKDGKGSGEADDRFWKLVRDKAGNGSAILRFLPAPKGEDNTWVRVWSHGFKGPSGQWYFENSLTTIGKPDPVSESNTELWNTGLEADKVTARERKRKLKHISNVLVVKDENNPENEGKVFLFEYGKKIFDKLSDAMSPEFDDDDPVNPFDFWDGADFVLRARIVDEYVSYDQCKFRDAKPLSDDDDKLEEIWAKCHSLQQFIDEKNYKPYDELKTKFDRVIGGAANKKSAEDQEDAHDTHRQAKAEEAKSDSTDDQADSGPSLEYNDDQDTLDSFKALADEG